MSAESRVLSGRYRVDELIGRGGMATVYRGFDLTLGRPVAVKILKRELADDGAFRTRFRLEAQAASRMSHPAIVRVFDAGEDTDAGRPLPYIVMELVEGTTLRDIAAAGPVPQDDAIRYVDGILEALEYSHRAGVVHRDIKPGNVMVTERGQVKVMDFGIARAVSDSSSTVAETTAIIGTASYFSPEQAKGEPVDARADLYSAGVVLYELLTGRPPFRGESPVAVAYQHVSEQPAPPSEVVETIPRAWDAVVLRALAKDPFQRFQDAASFREALDAARDGREPSRRQVQALSSELYGASPRQAAETARSLRQLSADTTMRRTQSGPPVAWIWAGVLVVAVIIIAVAVWAVSFRPGEAAPTNERTVPDLAGKTWDEANKELFDLDLLGKRADESSDDVPAGEVVRTDPASGSTVEAETDVTVYVSTGQELATVPTLATLSRADATAAIEAAGLTLGTVRAENDPTIPADIVLSAEIGGRPSEVGARVDRGTRVNLVVASGMVTLNDVTMNFSVEAASAILTQLGLVPVESPDPGCPATEPRMVKAQSAGPGDVPIGSEVRLTYCSG